MRAQRANGSETIILYKSYRNKYQEQHQKISNKLKKNFNKVNSKLFVIVMYLAFDFPITDFWLVWKNGNIPFFQSTTDGSSSLI